MIYKSPCVFVSLTIWTVIGRFRHKKKIKKLNVSLNPVYNIFAKFLKINSLLKNGCMAFYKHTSSFSFSLFLFLFLFCFRFCLFFFCFVLFCFLFCFLFRFLFVLFCFVLFFFFRKAPYLLFTYCIMPKKTLDKETIGKTFVLIDASIQVTF